MVRLAVGDVVAKMSLRIANMVQSCELIKYFRFTTLLKTFQSWKSNQPQSSSLQTATNNHKQTTKKRNTLIIATNPAYPNSQAS
jgi:hypothetical protein